MTMCQENVPGEAFDFEAQKILMYHWELKWTGKIHVTNNSEHAAYKVEVVLPENHGTTFCLLQPIDDTKPFAPNKTRKYEFVCRRYFVDTAVNADEILKPRLGLSEIKLEYANTSGTKFGTRFSPNDGDSKLRNEHYKLMFDSLQQTPED